MDQEQAKAILKKAFSVLNDEQIENFRWHLANETPVLCLERWRLYTDGMGGG